MFDAVIQLTDREPQADPRCTRMPRQLSAVGRNGAASAWSSTRNTLEAAIGEHPMAAFGGALVAGIVLGWWIKRR